MGYQQSVIGIAKLGTSIDTAVCDKCPPVARDEYMVNSFFGSSIWAVPCAVMDLFMAEQGISYAVVGGSAEFQMSAAIVIDFCVDEYGTHYSWKGVVLGVGRQGSTGISENDSNIMF